MQIYGLCTKVRWLLKTVGYQWLLYVYYAQTYIHIGEYRSGFRHTLFISLKDLCTKNTALPCYAYIFVLGSHSVSIPSFVILKKAQN